MKLLAQLDESENVIQYPVSPRELRQTYKALLADDPEAAALLPLRVVIVTPAPRPSVDPDEEAVPANPVKVAGVWTQQWDVVTLTGAALTARRDKLLARLNGLIASKQPVLSSPMAAAYSEVGQVDTPLIDAVVAATPYNETQVTNALTTRRNNWRTAAGHYLAVTFLAEQTAASGNVFDIQAAIETVEAL